MPNTPTDIYTGERLPGRKQILIATPWWGVSPPECQDWRMTQAYRMGKLEAHPNCPWQFSFGTVSDMLVQAARDLICKEAIRLNMDYVGMVDDDMYGPKCMNMWEQLLFHDLDIVAPLCFMRNPPHFPVVFANRGGQDTKSGEWHWQSHVVRNYPKNKLFECDAVGFGAVLIKTEVLKKMPEPWFFSMANKGEDIHFCHKARDLGFRVFCDSSLKLDHLSPRHYVGEEWYEAHNKDVDEIRAVHGDWNLARSRENLNR